MMATDFVLSTHPKFEKGCSHYKNTISLISKLRAAARAPGSIKVTMNEPFSLLADLTESPGCNQVLVISVNLTYYCNLRLMHMSVLVIKIIRHEKLI